MPARHRSRQHALQVLFSWDQGRPDQDVDQAITAFYESLGSDGEELKVTPRDEFMESLVRGTVARVDNIDRQISAKSENWRLERMPAVDRNILRLAVYEMTGMGTPTPVVIDEALELARQFSSEESVSFINGVLDAIRRDGFPENASGPSTS
jgi:N utilization substance protein B